MSNGPSGGAKHHSAVLQIQNIHKSYGRDRVLRGVVCDIRAGEVVLLLGANGSGKSTLMRICAGLTRADSGEVQAPLSGASRLRNIGYSGHQSHMYGDLTVHENLRLAACLLAVNPNISEVIHYWGLEQFSQKLVKELSKGQQARAALCRCLLADPEVLLLDEPTSALDDAAVALLLRRLGALMRGRSGRTCALVATHDTARLIGCADRVVVLHDGVIVADSAVLAVQSGVPDCLEAIEEVVSLYRGINR